MEFSAAETEAKKNDACDGALKQLQYYSKRRFLGKMRFQSFCTFEHWVNGFIIF